MSEGIKLKIHLGSNSLSLGPLQEVKFDNVATINANTAQTTIQARVPLPQDVQVVKVTANVSAISGSPAIQVVYGSGTPGTTAPLPSAPDVANPIAPVTTTLFSAPVCVAAANAPLNIATAVPEAVFEQASPGPNPGGAGVGMLTLRVLSGAGDTASNLKVTMLVRDIDPYPNLPGTTPFTNY